MLKLTLRLGVFLGSARPSGDRPLSLGSAEGERSHKDQWLPLRSVILHLRGLVRSERDLWHLYTSFLERISAWETLSCEQQRRNSSISKVFTTQR